MDDSRNFLLFRRLDNRYPRKTTIKMFAIFWSILKYSYRGSKFTTNELEIEIRERMGEPQ